MEADDSQKPLRLEPVGSLLQQAIEHPQLIVHRNPQGLKGAGGGVNPPPPRLGGITTGHGVGQGRGALIGALVLEVRFDPPGDAAGEPLLPVAIDQIRKLVLLQAIDQLSRSLPLTAGIHPHVQGTIQAKTEAPLRHIQLRAAHPQIRQHHHGGLGRHIVGKVGGHDRDAITEGGQTLRRRGPGRGVLVQSDQAQAGMLFQQQGAVAAAPKGGVDQQAIRTGDLPGRIQHRIGQHGHMAEGGHKPQAKTP